MTRFQKWIRRYCWCGHLMSNHAKDGSCAGPDCFCKFPAPMPEAV